MKLIGDDRREAIDWIQDRLLITRPEAERAMIGLLHEKVAITTDEGIFLTEEEEEAEKKGKRFSQRMSARKVRRKTTKQTKNVRKLEKQYNNKVPKKDDDDNKDVE